MLNLATTDLSDRPRHRLSRCPLRKVEVPTLQGFPCPRVQAAVPRRRRTFRGGWRRSRAPALAGPPGFEPGLHLGSFTIHERRTENSNPSDCSPSRLPTGARALTGSFSERKASGSNARRTYHPDLGLANRCLTNSASLPWYAGRELQPYEPSGTQDSETCASTFRHQRLAWPTRLELALRPWHGRVLPLTLRPHGALSRYRSCGLVLTEDVLRH